MSEAQGPGRPKFDDSHVESPQQPVALATNASPPIFNVNTQESFSAALASSTSVLTPLSKPPSPTVPPKTSRLNVLTSNLPPELVREVIKSAITLKSDCVVYGTIYDFLSACTLVQVSRDMRDGVMAVLKQAVVHEKARREKIDKGFATKEDYYSVELEEKNHMSDDEEDDETEEEDESNAEEEEEEEEEDNEEADENDGNDVGDGEEDEDDWDDWDDEEEDEAETKTKQKGPRCTRPCGPCQALGLYPKTVMDFYDSLDSFRTISSGHGDTQAALKILANVCDTMKDTDNFTEFPVFHSRDSYAHEDYYGPRYHQQVEILRIKAIMCKRKAEKAMEAAKAAKLAAIQYETGGVDPSLV